MADKSSRNLTSFKLTGQTRETMIIQHIDLDELRASLATKGGDGDMASGGICGGGCDGGAGTICGADCR